MSHFIDYCNEIESAQKCGFGRVVLPAAIALPDICSKVEYPDLKQVGERYKNWMQNFNKCMLPLEASMACFKCNNQDNCPQKNKDNEVCRTYKEAYDNGITQLADRLYKLRNNITHDGDLQGKHYLFDLAYSCAEFPLQTPSATDGEWAYGKAVVNLGALINALCLNAISYYKKASAEKKAKLDDFDKDVFYSNDSFRCQK